MTDRREVVTEALLASVAERGVDGASIRAVAARAGVAIGTVQHHFPTKEAMLMAAYEAVGGDIAARAEAAAADAPSVKAALRAVLLELLPLDARRIDELRVNIAFAAYSLDSEPLAAILRRDLAEIDDIVTAICAQADVADPKLEARLALAVTAGLSEPLMFGDARTTPADIVRALDAHLDRAFG